MTTPSVISTPATKTSTGSYARPEPVATWGTARAVDELVASDIDYLSLIVSRAKAANSAANSQNRVTTCVSFRPRRWK